MRETPYAFARKLCSGCQHAEPVNSLTTSGEFEIGCYAPVIPVPKMLEGGFDPFTEEPLPQDKIRVGVIYVNQPGASCTRPMPKEKGCPRAEIAVEAHIVARQYILPISVIHKLTTLFMFTGKG